MNMSNQELSDTLEDVINNTKIFDIHTHLFPSVFKSHSLSGFINLLNYHYLIAELLTNANISAEKFYSLDDVNKAKLIWKELFQNRTPISEACKGVLTVLQKLDINYKIVSTSNPSYFSYEDIRNEEIYSKYKLIINTTPLGMSPNIDSFPNIQYKFLNSNSYLYDLVYNPKQTKFLSKGKKNNSYTKNGLEMLETQAKISWDIWNK